MSVGGRAEGGGVVDDGGPQRPVGWWVKRVDGLLDAAFEQALAGVGATRREWQMLSSLEAGPVPAAGLLRSLGPFGDAEELAVQLDQLVGRGLVERSAGTLTLAPAGEARLAALRPAVGRVRGLVADTLPGDDYPALIGLLTRLAQGLAARGVQP
jgi:hypothetical protein